VFLRKFRLTDRYFFGVHNLMQRQFRGLRVTSPQPPRQRAAIRATATLGADSTLTRVPSVLCLLFASTATFLYDLCFTIRRHRRHPGGG